MLIAPAGIAETADPWTHTSRLSTIAMLGNHLPRQCGIATFTTDLSEALSAEFATLDCFVLAMNDAGRRYAYPGRVRFEITETDVASYRRAADFLNVSQVDLVSVQHEYGIFGGKAGSHLFALLRELRMPIVTTLHTILAEPNPLQRIAMDELAQLSERLVVMSSHGAALLRDVHHVPASKIDLIPHGIPSLPSAARSKDQLGVEGKSVILTFGLLSPDKGIEHVIDALPAILDPLPGHGLHRARRHAPAREGAPRRNLPPHAREPRQEPRRRFEHHLPQPVREPGRADEVPVGSGHLHHAVPQSGADHLGDAGLRRRLGQGRDLDAVFLRAGTARRRERNPGAVAEG